MKRVVGFVLCVILLATGCGRSSEGGGAWKTVTADNSSYTVSMPDQPKPIVQSVDVAQGKIDVHMQELITKDVNYTVGYSQYPAAFLRTMGPDAEAIFDRARDATVKQRGARVLEEKKGMMKGFPSRTVVMQFAMPENRADATMTQVMILAQERMYIVQTLLLAGAPAEASQDVSRFHQSFALEVQ